MGTCPYCEPMDYDFNKIVHDEDRCDEFFKNKELIKCARCKEEFYFTGCHDVYGNTEYFLVKKEKFEDLVQDYGQNDDDNLINYLSSERLKIKYSDAVNLLVSPDVSDMTKLSLIRPVIEEYLFLFNGGKEIHTGLKDKIKILENLNEELKEALVNLTDEAIKAIHSKVKLPILDPKKAMQLIELWFTIEFKIPKEEENMAKEMKEMKKMKDELELRKKSLNDKLSSLAEDLNKYLKK